MGGIGIVGAGVAGLQLALFLQRHGLDVTLYSDRTPEQLRAGRLPSLVVRFDRTRQRERALGVDHWDSPERDVLGVEMYVRGDPPLRWRGSFERPASGVDMRIYQATLLEDFAERGGRVVVATPSAADVARLGAQHEGVVVASGRGSLTEMFPRDPSRSPYTHPQRRLVGGFFRGVARPDPLRVLYAASPGHGEIFQVPFTTFEGPVCSILVEAIPGQAFDAIAQRRYEDDPKGFEAALLELLREHAPPIYAHVRPSEFAVTRPLDVLQGAIVPTVRRGYVPLDGGAFALALGDAHLLNDPIIAQGANTASRCAELLGQALLQRPRFDEAFCRAQEQALWASARPATEWTNAILGPPTAHVAEVLAAAARSQVVADEIAAGFDAPERNWEILRSPESCAAYLTRHGLR